MTQNKRLAELSAENDTIAKKIRELDEIYLQAITALEALYRDNLQEMAALGDQAAAYRLLTMSMLLPH